LGFFPWLGTLICNLLTNVLILCFWDRIYMQKHVICPYWEKLCSRQRAQFFPIRTDLGRQITCLFFFLWKITLWEIFVLIFYWSSFTLCACVWHFGQANTCWLQKYLSTHHLYFDSPFGVAKILHAKYTAILHTKTFNKIYLLHIQREFYVINVANRILYLYFTCEESDTSNQRRV